jgi:hypothetical protein
MPELPEVEVTRRQLAPLLVGRTIARAAMTRDSYFFLTKPATLARRLRGRRVDALTRRGKYLIAELDDHTRLLLHLGMTGQLFAANASSPRLLRATARGILAPEMQNGRFTPDAHTHLRLHFDDDGPEVYFRDTRKFGKVQLLNEGQPSDRLDKLGTDALIATGVDLYEAARSRRAPIKTVLLDQGCSPASATSTPTKRCTWPASARRVRPAPLRQRTATASSPWCSASCSARSRPAARASATTCAPTAATAAIKTSATSTRAKASRASAARPRSNAWCSASARPATARTARSNGRL